MPSYQQVTSLLLSMSLLPLPCMATDYFVSPGGNDSNGCTASDRCREIRRALTLVQPGDRILVADGKYLGFTADQIYGTQQSPITIQALGTGAEILPTTDRGTFEDRDNIYITFCEHLIIDGLRTFNAPRAGLRLDASHNITVRNSVFGDNGKWGIFTNHSNNPLIELNELYGSADEHGIYISNSGDGPKLRGNVIHDNNANGIHMNGDLSAGSHGGVIGDGIISSALVENNVIYNNGTAGGGGINMDGVQESVIRNNVIYNNHASGIVAYRIDGGAGPSDLEIYHNSIDMATDGRYALQVSETSGAITIRNNILYNRNSTRGGLAYGLQSDTANVDSDYNVFGGAAWIAFDDWTLRKTLTQWQAEGGEPNSIEATLGQLFVDPSNTDLAARDFHLHDSATAIDQGETLITVTSDRDGRTRPEGVASDMGAYEADLCTAAETHLVLLPQSVVAPTDYDACETITAGLFVLVTGSGQLNLRAPIIHLAPGFMINPGGTLNVVSETP